MTFEQNIIDEFEKKYQSFELSETIDKKSFERHREFILTALEQQKQQIREEIERVQRRYIDNGFDTTDLEIISHLSSLNTNDDE